MRYSPAIAVFDLETTGLSPSGGDRVIEIGAVILNNGRIEKEFHSLVNPQVPVPETVANINGITQTMLKDQPEPETIFPQFSDFIKNSALVAHNAKFDISFLRAELARLGLRLTNKFKCTLQMSRKRYPKLPNHRLETVARHLLGDIHQDLTRHRALNDARLTAMVWLEMMKGN